MNKLKIQKTSENLFLLSIFLLLLIFFYWLFFFTYYTHETGHILFGLGDGLIKGKINKFEIGNHVQHPLTSFILLPQQVKIIEGKGSLNFMLGGPIFNIILFFSLSLLGYKLSKNKLWFLLFISIVVFEISGNIICGTDNFTGNSLSICNETWNSYLLEGSKILFAGVLAWLTTIRLKPYGERILRLGFN